MPAARLSGLRLAGLRLAGLRLAGLRLAGLRLPIAVAGWIVLGIALLSTCGAGQPDLSASVYQVKVDRCATPENQWATGVALAPGILITVAHSLTQAQVVTVLDRTGVEQPAEVIYLDNEKDIAMLRVADPTGPNLTLAEPREEMDVAVATFSGPGNPVVKSASILDLVEITLDGEGRRSGLKLRAEISRGDSGAPVVNRDGHMVGMVFATARGQQVGWAVASSEVSAALEQVTSGRPEAIPPAC